MGSSCFMVLIHIIRIRIKKSSTARWAPPLSGPGCLPGPRPNTAGVPSLRAASLAPPLIPSPSPPGTGGEGSFFTTTFYAAPSPAVAVGEGCPDRGGVRWVQAGCHVNGVCRRSALHPGLTPQAPSLASVSSPAPSPPATGGEGSFVPAFHVAPSPALSGRGVPRRGGVRWVRR